MSNQIVISSGAKVRNLSGVLTGTSGIVSSVPLGGANGVATLDSGGKVPVSQLPASVVTYLGTWNAATNTPTLTNGTGDAGDMYLCNVAGTVDFGAGSITFAVGDWVLYGSGTWQKSNGQNGTVTSVAVTESGDALTITGSPITTSGTINIGFAGNSGQYINGAGGLTTFPSLTGFVPYTGATAEVDLGFNNLSASHIVLDGYSYGDGGALNFKQFSSISVLGDGYTSIGASGTNLLSFNYSQGGFNSKSFKFDVTNITTSTSRTYLMPNANGTLALTSDLGAYLPLTGGTLTGGLIGTTGSFASSGSGNTFSIDHSSGSGIALNITKAGDGEGLYINKTSGSGNAATIVGTLNATTLVKDGGTSSQFLMADGSVNTSVLPSGAYLPLSGGTLTGALSGTSATFSSSLIVGSTPILYGNVAIKSNSATSYFGLNVIANANNNFIAVNHTGTAGVIETEFSTGGGYTPLSLVVSGSERMKINTNGSTAFVYRNGSGEVMDLLLSTETAESKSKLSLMWYGNETASIKFKRGGDATGGSLEFWTQAETQSIAQRMTILANGNVGIGTSSPTSISNYIAQTINGSSGSFTEYQQGGSYAFRVGSDGSSGGFISQTDANPIRIFTNGSERMRITSSGNVGIGTTNPTSKLSMVIASSGSNVSGLDITNNVNASFNVSLRTDITEITAGGTGNMVFSNTAERMRITSGGNVGIGMTGFPNCRLTSRGVDNTSSNWAFFAEDLYGNTILGARNDGAVYAGSIGTSTGTDLVLTSGGYLVKNSSSIRYKKDVQPIDIGLDFILSLNPVSYNLKDGDIPQVGFIAEDFPDDRLVSTSMIDPTDESKGYQKEGVNYAQIVAPLVKAIQELNEKIKQLENK